MNTIVHSIEKPNRAPTWENVAIPLGSSSAAPVTTPGPRSRRTLRTRVRELPETGRTDALSRLRLADESIKQSCPYPPTKLPAQASPSSLNGGDQTAGRLQ